MICQCGCGQVIVEKPFRACKYYKPQRFLVGHNLKLDGCHVLTDEHKRKIGEAQKGRISPMKGKNHSETSKEKCRKSNLGQKRSEESRLKMRIAHLGKPAATLGRRFPERCGTNSINWKGGSTPLANQIRGSLEYKNWERGVLARSNRRCIRCNSRSKTAHHIQNFADFPELRFDQENGVGLCRDCHEIFHFLYGKQLNTAKQLARFVLFRGCP